MLPDPRANANLLLIEVGNSHTSIAVSRDGRLSEPTRIDNADIDALPQRLTDMWNTLPERKLRVIVLASVVPQRAAEIRQMCASRFECELVTLGEDVPAPIENALQEPKRVGIDRLCAAVAAWTEIQGACVVASFGTATTIDCINDEGVFMGGAILPGLTTQAWSLHQRTAQLPEIKIQQPVTIYGASTEDAIRNGIAYGAAGALREIVERYATDLAHWPRLVLTGGHAPMMRELCDFVDALVPDLVLRGMEQSYRAFYRNDEEQ